MRFEALPGTLEALAGTLRLRPDRLKRLLRALMELQYVKIDESGQFMSTERGHLLQEGPGAKSVCCLKESEG